MAKMKHISFKKVILLLADIITAVISTLVSYFLLTSLQIFSVRTEILPVCICGFTAFCIAGLMLWRSYHTLFAVDYVMDFARSIIGFSMGEFAFAVILALGGLDQHLKFVAVCILVGLIIFVFQRIAYFILIKRLRFIIHRKDFPKALIIGAGMAGRGVLNEILHSKDHNYNVIGFVDDDEKKISRYIDSVFVYGPTVLIPELCSKYSVKEIIFAIPTCPEDKKQQILKICSSTGCNIKIIPSLFELKSTNRFLSQIKNIDVEDLLGRDIIRLNDTKVADFINNKTVLVTGVGSIGSELCRQIVKFGPKKLIMVDIYENNAYDIQQELISAGYGNLIETVIASVRDREKIRAVLSKYQPDVIFHAAAHKHVPLMEDDPEEAVKNNILGTFNVAKLANENGVKKMVLISTDKAVNPTNVMGATKRCCEMIMQYMSQITNSTEYVAVRFGNVLGSSGSVIPLFSKQIEAGGPVTVTHPDIIRYFMTIPEAASLVLEAGTMASSGEIHVLDMGEPVKITTLAENLIRLYGFKPYIDIQIKFVGLRPGEKLFEELLMSEEGLRPTANNKIFIGKSIEIDAKDFERKIEEIRKLAANNEKEAVVKVLHELVPTFNIEQRMQHA